MPRRDVVFGWVLVLVGGACASGPDRVDQAQRSSAAIDWSEVNVVAYPRSPTEIEVTFTVEIDAKSALDVASYELASGAKLYGVERDETRERTYVLHSDFMDPDALKVDRLKAEGVKTAGGGPLKANESPPFVQGVLDVIAVAKTIGTKPPFASDLGGSIVSMSCVPCCPPKMLEDAGFTFLQQTLGGPYSGIKVVVDELGEDVVAAAGKLPRGLGPHVLFRGGWIDDTQGELRLVDTGFMRSSVYDDATPLPTPPSVGVRNADIAGQNADSGYARSLGGVAVELADVRVLSVESAAEGGGGGGGGRIVTYVDKSGVANTAWVLPSVTREIAKGETFDRMRGEVHRVNGVNQVVVVFEEDLK